MSTTTNYDSAVAIVGMAGRFPGATTVEELWDNLRRTASSRLRPDVRRGAGRRPGSPASTLANPIRALRQRRSTTSTSSTPVFGFSRREAETMESAAPGLPGVRLGGAGERRVRPERHRGHGRRLSPGCGFSDYMLNIC